MNGVNKEIIPEMLKMQRIETFKKELNAMIAKSKDAYVKSNAREPAHSNRFRRDFSKEEIHRIITGGTAVEQASLSEYFFSVSGVYKRIVLHYATFLTYSWVMVPHVKRYTDKLKDKKNQKVYYDAAEFCSSFGIERKCAHFAKLVLVDGGYYGLIHDNGESIAIQDLPFEFCRSRYKNSQDVDIIEFDVRFFDTIREESYRNQIIKTYPKIIQKAYKTYKRGGEPWVFLPAELGIYFTLFEERPFFLDLIPLIDDLEDYKEMDKERNMLSLKRILVQESPRDGMNVVFEPEELADMHEGVLEMLVNTQDTDVISTYNKIHLLDLSGVPGNKTELQQAQQLIYDSAGVSKELFSASTDAGITFSLNNDLSMMMVLGQGFAHFFSALLNYKFGNKRLSFKLLILPISFYNAYDYTSKAKDLAAFGYSFLTPILSSGIDQTNLADLKSLENDVLDLDEALKPLQSAYTQSGKTNAVTAQAAKTSSGENNNTDSKAEDVGSKDTNDESNNKEVDSNE